MPCPEIVELGIHAVGSIPAGIYTPSELSARGQGRRTDRDRLNEKNIRNGEAGHTNTQMGRRYVWLHIPLGGEHSSDL